MLFQPTNVIPSSFAGVGGDLIDATDGMTISWQVNGTSPMTGYQIKIYRSYNGRAILLYDSGQVNLSTPFYGVDGDGNVQRYSVTLSASTLSSAGVTNGWSQGYILTIDEKWGTSWTTTVARGKLEYFMAQAKPTATIDTTEITGPSAALTGTYSQSAGISLAWVRWIITTGDTSVHDSGKIHTQELNYTYDGFLDDTEYEITMNYQTENGYEGSVSTTITSDWTLMELRYAELSVAKTSDCAGIAVETPAMSVGTLEDSTATYDISDGMLRFQSSGYLQWGGNAGTTGNTFVWRGRLPVDSKLDITINTTAPGTYHPKRLRIYEDTRQEGVWRVTVTGGGLNFFTTSFNETDYPPKGDPGYFDMIVVINGNPEPSSLGVYHFKVYVWPDVDSDGYPTSQGTGWFEGFATEAENAYIKWTATTSGIQSYYLGTGNFGVFETWRDETLKALRSTTQPAYDGNWIYLSNWSGTGAEDIGLTNEELGYQSSIYRQDMSAGIMQKLCNISAGESMIDYGVKSGALYKYLQVVSTADGKQAIFTSGDIPATTCFWNWIVDTGVWDDERGAYEYTGSYIFGLNLETDAFDNGNNPNLLQNFTQYPTRQGTNQNYLSGQLTAYLGHVDTENNVYIDTAAEAEAIRALSTSTDTKFLRSRKGERWMIDTSGPIRLSLGDKYREQPYTVSLPWVEVGDASDAALISLPGDAAWTDPTTVPSQIPYITINGVKYIPVSGSMGINGNQYNF